MIRTYSHTYTSCKMTDCVSSSSSSSSSSEDDVDDGDEDDDHDHYHDGYPPGN